MLDDLITLFERDLTKLRDEVLAYPDKASLWQVAGHIANPGGTLALHLAGAFRHFIGVVLGGGDYVRDRPLEFAARDVSRAELLANLTAALAIVRPTLAALTDADLDRDFPVRMGERTVSTRFFLLHQATHLGYHLGQVNYHCRLLTSPAP
jgi:uncharacterized damage-inducible protein DinB